MIRGCCECRRVQFEVDGGILDFGHCHCSKCRRLHGAAYATFAGVERSAFRYVVGENEISTYASSEFNDRMFCSNCGSAVAVVPHREPARLYLCMSAIEGDPPRPAGYHAWVGSKAPWHEIADELPRFPEAAE